MSFIGSSRSVSWKSPNPLATSNKNNKLIYIREIGYRISTT
jgi:hypothetical protein